MIAIPQLIENDRLIIRPITHEDVDDYYHLTRTTKTLSPLPFDSLDSRHMVWKTLARFMSPISECRAFAVMDKRGKLQGVIFITVDDVDRKTSLSWMFRPILDQVVRAIELFLGSLNGASCGRIEILIHPAHMEAAELAMNLDFQKEANLPSHIFRNGKYHDVWLFSRMSRTIRKV